MSVKSRSEVLPSIAAALGLVRTLSGLNALFRPKSGLQLLDFPRPSAAPSSSSASDPQKLADNLIRQKGARDIFLGLSTCLVFLHGDRKLLGYMILLGSGFVPLVDGWVTNMQIGRGEWKHWSFIPIASGIAGGLFEWY